DAVKALGERFNTVEARVDEVEKQPATKAAGFAVDVEVTKDEEDKEPQKGLGEFLQLVSQGDPRELRKYQSDEKGLVGYYDLTKAVGQKTVDRIAHAVKGTKAAPTGLGELVPSGGGFLVGTDMPGGVLGRDHNVGQILSRVDITPISANSNAMTFNAEDETSRANGSRRGGIRAFWAAEASAKTASQPKFRQMELKLNKVIGLVYATDELLADASALEAWIMQNLPEELRFVVEDAIYRGTGAGQPLGILNSNCLVSVAKETGQAATTILSENVIKMWARRWLGGRDYVWFVNQDTMPQLMQMSLAVGTGGNLTYLPPGGLSGSPFGSLMARPVIEVEYAATLGTVGDIVLVDLGQYQAIDKGGIQSASSIHVRFVNDETVFRFVYRFDGQPKWDAALTPFQGSNTVSPFVALATRA
ncbi:MAG: phage major capsid protein, partial [Anaerolineae bacterium]